jgi:hypothetical protein
VRIAVIAGLDPAIPTMLARPRLIKRDGRVKPGHDQLSGLSASLKSGPGT